MSWMGDTDLPIMDIPGSIVPVDIKDVHTAKKEVVERLNYQHAFCYDNMTVDFGNVHMININCVCHFCQALKTYAGGKSVTECSSYSIPMWDLDITVIFQLKLTTDGGTMMHVRNHTSKKFTVLCIHDQSLHIGLTASHFYEHSEEI